MEANEYWLNNRNWAALEPLIPLGRRGMKSGNNRQIISGILHVLKFGCRWRDCPAIYGPHTTVYNRFNRWSKARIWQSMFERVVSLDNAEVQLIDSTHQQFAPLQCRRRRRGRSAGDPPRQAASFRLLELISTFRIWKDLIKRRVRESWLSEPTQ